MKLPEYSCLPRDFYLIEDTVKAAKLLLGKVLCTLVNGIGSAGIITETEAYAGVADKASHAYNGRLTRRTEIMFHPGGTAYVYLCYGVHSLFNVVISGEGVPNAVLVRSIKPLRGIDAMIQRTGKAFMDRNSGTGPGNTAKLLGIHYSHSGIDLCRTPDSHQHDFIWIRDEGFLVPESEIATGPRIGVAYAAEDALLPYRFVWNWK